MRIVVGLGNPGREYAATRHNIGFMIVEELARRGGNPGSRRRFRSEIAELRLDNQKLVLVKPQTYMNLSGHAVREVLNWYHVPVEDVLIVADDLDLPFGTTRMRARGSAGGHNGLASIIEQLGTVDVPRFKIGIGRGRSAAKTHVLSRFSSDEERELPALIARAADMVELWVRDGIIEAMNQANQKAKPAAVPVSTSASPKSEAPPTGATPYNQPNKSHDLPRWRSWLGRLRNE